MKILIKSYLLTISGFVFISCAIQQPIEKKKPENNATYEVEYLFEHDGCKVYRFLDNGHYVYFTNCKGNVTSIEGDSIATRINTVTNQSLK